MQTVSDDATPHLDDGCINTTSDIVSTSEYIATIDQTFIRNKHAIHLIGLVFYFLLITHRKPFQGCRSIIFIAYTTIIDNQIGRAKDGTTFSTTVGITLNCGHTIVETIVIGKRCLIFANTYDNMSHAWPIRGRE